jgi:hypothetical protein
MQERIHEHILAKIGEGDNFREGKGNLLAYNILVNVAIDRMLQLDTEEEIKAEIDRIVSDPTQRLIG